MRQRAGIVGGKITPEGFPDNDRTQQTAGLRHCSFCSQLLLRSVAQEENREGTITSASERLGEATRNSNALLIRKGFWRSYNANTTEGESNNLEETRLEGPGLQAGELRRLGGSDSNPDRQIQSPSKVPSDQHNEQSNKANQDEVRKNPQHPREDAGTLESE